MINFSFKLLLIIAIIGMSCEPPKSENKEASIRQKKDGLIKTYDDYGHLQSEINYRGGIKHGKSLLYHDGSDQVMLEMTYREGKRSGIARKFYENGKIYAETPYEDDEVNGIVKLYYRNGHLKAEIPYHQSKNGLGLKEYYTSGELKTYMPEIKVRLQTFKGQSVYYFSIENCTEANFYIGSLLNNQYLIEDLPFVEILPKRNGEALYGFPESAKGDIVNVICSCRTTAKNPYVVRKVLALGES
ncbi:MAG: hypothetical protein RIC06_12470 [Cyclobacteriaceae bacterium]